MGFELNWHPKGVTKHYFGWVTGEDLLRSLEQTEADEHFDSLRYVINDFLAIDGVLMETIHPELIEELAAIDKAASGMNPGIKIAIVATDPNVLNLAQAYVDSKFRSFPTRLFSTLAEAKVWLGHSIL